MTINPTSDLAAGSGYYVSVASGVIQDIVGNGYSGFTDSTFFNFTTSAPTTPEITVLGNGTNIVDGDTSPSTSDYTDFGSVTQGGTAVQHTFTIRNDGAAPLTLGSITPPSGFSVIKSPASSIAAGSSDTFTVQLNTTTAGTYSGDITFSDNDSNENPFNFFITGTVNALPSNVISGDAGDNVLNGTNGDDQIYGLAGNDTLYGNAGNDLLDGGAGNDILAGGGGVNTLDGGLGTDTAEFSLAPGNYYVAANADGGYTVRGPGETDTLTNVENASFDGTGQTLTMAQFVSQSFSPLEYLASNTDLLKAFGDNPQAAVQHYVDNGFSEGRSTNSFDPLEYIASNPDLIKAFGANAQAGLQHYVDNGFAEGRATTRFNALEYLASNTDLLKAFGDNPQAAVRHYVDNGFAENRATNSFDSVAYLLSNPDLGAAGYTAQTAVQHYVDRGYSEGRTAGGAFGTEQTQHALTLGVADSDAINWVGDQDWFSVALEAGHSYNLTLSGADSSSGTLADPFLGLYNTHGLMVISDNDNGPGRDSLIHFTAATSGTYYLVASANNTGTGTYKLCVATGG